MSIETDQDRFERLQGNLKLRSEALHLIRDFFYDQQFIEVQTPVRLPAPAPEEHIIPECSGDWYLSTSPELQMKRLIAGGLKDIYQIGPVFRQGEKGHLHNPEFTLIEWYRVDREFDQLKHDCESLIKKLLNELGKGLKLTYQGRNIDFSGPWPSMSVSEAFIRYAKWDPLEDIHSLDSEKFYFDLVDKVEPNLPQDRPLFLIDYPAPFASLARLNSQDDRIAQRFELYIGGIEIANAYNELTDPAVQRERFSQEALIIENTRNRRYPLDEKFLSALASGLDDCLGIALGLDRLLMITTDAADISDVLAFPFDRI